MYCPKCRKEIPVVPPQKGEKCPACSTVLWSRKTAFWNLPHWLRVLICFPVGLCMLVVYLGLFNQGNLILTEGLVHLPGFVLLAVMYIVLAWVKGKLTKGFARVMLITALIVAGWALIFVVWPLCMDGVTWLMNRLFRVLKKVIPGFKVYKKGDLTNTYELTVLVHAVLALEALLLHFAVRNRFMKPGLRPVLMVAAPLGIYWFLYLRVVRDITKELRKIKIAEFIGFWMERSLHVEVVTVAVVCLCVLAAGLILLQWAKRQRYTDGDLMAIRKFTRVRVVGYWLLKAKLDGMLEHSWEPPTEDRTAVHSLRAAKVSPEVREAYCAENPQMAPVFAYLDANAESGPVGIIAVLRDVQLEPGDRTRWGVRAEKWYALVKKFALLAAWVCGALVWLPGFTKYLICIFLGKTADDIMLHVALFAPVLLVGLGVLMSGLARLIWKLSFRRSLLRRQASGAGKGNELLLDADQREIPFTDEEITQILRAYTLRPYGSQEYGGWDHQSEYFFALLGAVEDMALIAE